VAEGHQPDFDAIVNHFRHHIDQFTRGGSGYILERVRQLGVCFVKFRPLGSAGSFVPTPPWIIKKKAVVNVQKNDDDYCVVGFSSSASDAS